MVNTPAPFAVAPRPALAPEADRCLDGRTIGVLALQGDVAAHTAALQRLGAQVRAVKTVAGLERLDALVLPGGESTTMLLLMEAEGLHEPLVSFCRSGRPVLGTCAGAILLATEVTGPSQPSLGILDITIERNAYGRQADSFATTLTDGEPSLAGVEGVFIRAPVIRRTGADVTVLLRHKGRAVLVRSGAVTAATFHPEMTADARILGHALSP